MKIIRSISSIPVFCKMTAKGFFGNLKGEVTHFYNGRDWYGVFVDGKKIGEATNFDHACNMLLDELNVVKTICI